MSEIQYPQRDLGKSEPSFWVRFTLTIVGALVTMVVTGLIMTGGYREKIDNLEKVQAQHESEIAEMKSLIVETAALQKQQAEWNKLMMDHILGETKNVRSR